MTRRGMPTKNVGLFYRKALNPAPEAPHITFWMLDIFIYIMKSLVEAPRPGVKEEKHPKCVVQDWKLDRSCPASGGAELSTATEQN